MSFDPSFAWLPRAARRQLVAVACIGFLLGTGVTLVWASVLPTWLLLFVIVPVASVVFWTLAGQIGREVQGLDFHGDLGPPPVQPQQIWRDPTALDELILVTQVRPGGESAVIERIAGSSPETLHKRFTVLTRELAARFDLLCCIACKQPTGAYHLGTCEHSAMQTGELPPPVVEVRHCIEELETL
jgi:hypothetical protein